VRSEWKNSEGLHGKFVQTAGKWYGDGNDKGNVERDVGGILEGGPGHTDKARLNEDGRKATSTCTGVSSGLFDEQEAHACRSLSTAAPPEHNHFLSNFQSCQTPYPIRRPLPLTA